jgi:hypothetical protein
MEGVEQVKQLDDTTLYRCDPAPSPQGPRAVQGVHRGALDRDWRLERSGLNPVQFCAAHEPQGSVPWGLLESLATTPRRHRFGWS